MRPSSHCRSRRSGLRLRRAEPPRGVHRHVHQPVHRHRGTAPARRHRRRGAAAAAGARLARDLVRLAAADAGAGPGLRGHRGRPARHRPVRQTRGRLRHRHPGRRPGRADGRPRPPAVRRRRPRHGFAISYALAADHPDRVARAVLAEIPGSPGAAPSPPVFVPGALNDRLWHLPFNRLDRSTSSSSAAARTSSSAGSSTPPPGSSPTTASSYYVRILSDPDALRASFGWYRALDATIAQDGKRKTRRCPCPSWRSAARPASAITSATP